jgi:serine/threonine-protein kinase RsbW
MSEEQWIWQRDHVIRSNTEAGRRVLDEVLEELKARRWCQGDVFAVHLAVEEALVNAITHGNRLDPDKHVQISCRLSPELIRVEISDEGPGFDPAALPNPTDPDRLECPSGRGVLLMKAFMSRVEWGESGNRVVLERQRRKAE